MEIQQSALYIKYIQQLGWKTKNLDGVKIIYKHFPLLGGLGKIQRPMSLPNLKRLVPLLKDLRIRKIAVEPDRSIDEKMFRTWIAKLRPQFKINKSPFLPTKTIRIDLMPSEVEIFQRFTEAKRRGVRRALNHGVVIKESTNIDDLIRIKNKSAGFLGFITTWGIDKLWPIFSPRHAAILLAYCNSPAPPLSIRGGKGGVIVGGVLLLFWRKIAYYWIAGATHQGKKVFAPTLLVWEALKLGRRRGCTKFDFVGIWDERLPQHYDAWRGFTKFKEGFGGTAIYYPIIPRSD